MVFRGALLLTLAYFLPKIIIILKANQSQRNPILSCQKDLSQGAWKAKLKYGSRIYKLNNLNVQLN